MTKNEYVEWFWDQDYHVIANLVDKVWNDACAKTTEEVNNIIREYEKVMSVEEMGLLYKIEESVNNLKPKLS